MATVDSHELRAMGADAHISGLHDPEKADRDNTAVPSVDHEHQNDIEHAYVKDDPRLWSRTRKNIILAIVATASMIATLGANIYNPAISQIEQELHASSNEISLSLSLFILVQGNAPLFWSAASEIKGRKAVYLCSVSLFIVGCIVVATAKSIGVVIGMRCVQAAGGAAVLAIGAATLADIYEPHERGTMMGIYYAAPLLGPSLGPLLGGILTQLFNWRATFWFLAIFGGVSLLSFVVFKDTYRRERSLTYQTVLKRMMAKNASQQNSTNSSSTNLAKKTVSPGPGLSKKDIERQGSDVLSPKQGTAPAAHLPASVQDIRLTIKDIETFRPLWMVLQRKNNVVTLCSSGLMFALSYCIAYTASITFSKFYNYDALQIGLVLLSFGLGCMGGSLLGGRWSDRVLRRLKAENGGQSYPEMRLQSAKLAMPFLPLSIIAYAWCAEKRVNVVAVCVTLFLTGFFLIWQYSCTLAYIVDANTGRSSTAVATNSTFRGIAGFVAAEAAAPLQIAMGDSGLYMLWAGLMTISELLLLLVIWKGPKWRQQAMEKEATKQRS